MNLELESGYGDIFIQELDGLALMEIQYGNLKSGPLSRGNQKPYNSLELAYSNGTIESAGWIEVELSYSDLEIGTSSMIFSENKYSDMIGEKVDGIVTEGGYDKYIFDEVGSFVGELKYSRVKFEKLTKKFVVESKYTPIQIMNLSRGFKEVVVSSSYGNVHMKVEEGASFKFEGESRYGNINLAREGKLSKTKEGNMVKIWGNVGSSPKGEMNIVTRYGNINIE
jgi:hypothetical protein